MEEAGVADSQEQIHKIHIHACFHHAPSTEKAQVAIEGLAVDQKCPQAQGSPLPLEARLSRQPHFPLGSYCRRSMPSTLPLSKVQPHAWLCLVEGYACGSRWLDSISPKCLDFSELSRPQSTERRTQYDRI